MKFCFIFILLLILPFVSAEEIKLSRTSYLSQETLQAEITFQNELSSDLNPSNILIRDSAKKTISFSPNLVKLSNVRYYLYFNLPVLANGEYSLIINNVKYKNSILSFQILKSFTINNPHEYFDEIKSNYESKALEPKELALISLSLKNIFPETSEKALNSLINIQDPLGCYPKGNCKVEDTAFALLALKKSDKFSVKTLNWLKGAENNFETGEFILKTDRQCSLKEINFTNELKLAENTINLTCSQLANIQLIHRYLGNDFKLLETNSLNLTYEISKEKCYGIYYKSSCKNYETALVNYIFKQINENSNIEYLDKNADERTTLDQAFLVLLSNKEYSKNWLINNIQNNYFPKYSYEKNSPDIQSTIYSYLALKDSEISVPVRAYLLNLNTDYINRELISYYLLDNEKSRNSISVYPAIITKNNTELIIKNNKNNEINLSIISDSMKENYVLKTTLTIPIFIENKNSQLEVKYNEFSYYIPVVTSKENLSLSVILNPKADFIGTNEEILDKIEMSLETDESKILPLSIKVENLKSLDIRIDEALKNVVRIKNENITDIDSATIANNIYLNEKRNATGIYSGFIAVYSNNEKLNEIKVSLDFLSSPKNLTLIQKPKTANRSLTITGNNSTKSNTDKGPSSFWIIVLIVIILLVAIAAFVIYKAKGKDRNFQDYLDKIKR